MNRVRTKREDYFASIPTRGNKMKYIKHRKIKISCLRYNQLTEGEFDGISVLPFYVMVNKAWMKGTTFRLLPNHPDEIDKYKVRYGKTSKTVNGNFMLWIPYESLIKHLRSFECMYYKEDIFCD